MTTTTLDSPDFEPQQEHREPAPDESARTKPTAPIASGDGNVAEPPPLIVASGMPNTLLSEKSDNRAGNTTRVALGLVGLAALGVVPPGVLLVSNGDLYQSNASWPLTFVLQLFSLPGAAALTLTLSLPGLLILLNLFNEELPVKRMLNAVARAYFRMGLLTLGAAPALLFFACTGATTMWVTVGATLSYFAAGGVALALLLHDFYQALTFKKGISGLLVLAWACFSSLLGLYLFVRMNPWTSF